MLLNLIKHQRPDIDKIYLFIKDPLESKYQLLINGRGKIGIKKLKNPKAFSDHHSQIIDDVYENLEDYNLTENRKVLILFDDMIAYMESNKKLSSIVTEEKKEPKISLAFISQSYFKVAKTKYKTKCNPWFYHENS